jgi:hypothetical protein
MQHNHPAILNGTACTLTTAEMIRAGARGERVVCTDPAARTAIYMANRRAGYRCRVVLQNNRVYLYPNKPDALPSGGVLPAWACSKGCDIGPDTIGNTTGPWSGKCGRFGRGDL